MSACPSDAGVSCVPAAQTRSPPAVIPRPERAVVTCPPTVEPQQDSGQLVAVPASRPRSTSSRRFWRTEVTESAGAGTPEPQAPIAVVPLA